MENISGRSIRPPIIFFRSIRPPSMRANRRALMVALLREFL